MKVVPKPNPKQAAKYDGEFASYLDILKMIRGENDHSPYTLSMWERDRPIYILDRGKVTHTIFSGDVVVRDPNQALFGDPVYKVLTSFELDEDYDILDD